MGKGYLKGNSLGLETSGRKKLRSLGSAYTERSFGIIHFVPQEGFAISVALRVWGL